MALNFPSAGAARVDCGSAAGIDDFTAFTYLTWLNFGSLTSGDTIWSKGKDIKHIEIRASSRLRLRVARATTSAEAETGDNFVSTGADIFLAVTYDETDGPRLFSAVSPATIIEEDSYAAQTVGVGSTTADAAELFLIGNRSDNDKGMGGDISTAMYFNTRLTLAQIQALQWHMRNQVSTKGHWILGFNGTGTQHDRSGNGNDGTVTTATVADHAPLPPPIGFGLGWQGAFTVVAVGGLSIPVAMHNYYRQRQWAGS